MKIAGLSIRSSLLLFLLTKKRVTKSDSLFSLLQKEL